MENIQSKQASLIEKYVIAELELTNTTYTMIGGYNAATYSSNLRIPEIPRSPEIKGAWRWWFRACLAGAIWESCEPLDDQRRELIRRTTEEIMGSAERGASSTILQVIPLKIGRMEKLDERSGIPRMILLSRARDEDKLMCYKPYELEFKIRILKRPQAFKRLRILKLNESSTVRCLIGSLLMSIIFQGIGAATRRGFGSLIVKSFKISEEYEELIKNYKNLIQKLNKIIDKNQYRNILEKLIQMILEDFSSLIGITRKSECPRDTLPPFPIVTEDRDLFKIEIKEVRANDEKNLLEKIGNATMKSQWKRVRSVGIRCKGKDQYTLSTFILGLPRKGEHRGKRRTFYSGYWVRFNRERDPGRRPSAISIKVLKRAGRSRWLCLIYGMLSKDWPERLVRRSVYYKQEWIKGKRRLVPYKEAIDETLSLNESTLRNRFNNAFSMVIQCLQ